MELCLCALTAKTWNFRVIRLPPVVASATWESNSRTERSSWHGSFAASQITEERKRYDGDHFIDLDFRFGSSYLAARAQHVHVCVLRD